jgi:hypothetical protein
VLVVEGYMDVVMLAQHGINAAGTLGTSDRNHLQRLWRYTPAWFSSTATRRVARPLRALEIARRCRTGARRLPVPAEGEDPDSCATDRRDVPQLLPRPLSEYLFEHHGHAVDLEHWMAAHGLNNLRRRRTRFKSSSMNSCAPPGRTGRDAGQSPAGARQAPHATRPTRPLRRTGRLASRRHSPRRHSAGSRARPGTP